MRGYYLQWHNRYRGFIESCIAHGKTGVEKMFSGMPQIKGDNSENCIIS